MNCNSIVRPFAAAIPLVFGCALCVLLFVAPPALAAETAGFDAAALETADFTFLGAPQQVAAQVPTKTLKPGKKYTFYAYYGGAKLKGTITVTKPKVTKKGNKKTAKLKAVVKIKKPTLVQVMQIGAAYNADSKTMPTGAFSAALVDYKTGKSIEKKKWAKVKQGEAKASGYTTIMAGVPQIPLKFTQTMSVTLPKTYKKAAVCLSMLDKDNEPTVKYQLRIK